MEVTKIVINDGKAIMNIHEDVVAGDKKETAGIIVIAVMIVAILVVNVVFAKKKKRRRQFKKAPETEPLIILKEVMKWTMK